MNIPKSDILNPDATEGDSTSAAVKLALAETHIITETKSYLESEGINLSAFSSLDTSGHSVRPRRSDTASVRHLSGVTPLLLKMLRNKADKQASRWVPIRSRVPFCSYLFSLLDLRWPHPMEPVW